MVGFLRGILLGAVVALGALVVVAKLTGPPAQRAIVASSTDGNALTATQPPGTGAGATRTPDASPDTDPEEAAEAAPPASSAGSTPGTSAPDISVADTPMSETTGSPTPAAGAFSDAPQPDALIAAPAAPEGNTAVAEVARPAADAQGGPEVSGSVAPVMTVSPDAPASPAPSPAEAPARPPSSAPGAALDTRVADAVAPPELPQVADVGAPEAAMPASPAAPSAERAPEPADLPPPPPLTPAEEALLQPLPDTFAPDATFVRPEAQGTARSQTPTLVPSPGLTGQARGVVTGRLPRIGDPPPSEVPSQAASDGGTAPVVVPDATLDPELALAPDESLPPLQRFARPFDNPEAKPVFSILLIDDGLSGPNRQALAEQELPLSIVIDPLSEGADARASLWRAGGQEVIMAATGIPQGAQASDMEQTFQALSDRLPEAIAVIDVSGKAFQDNRQLAAQIVPILSAQGRGLLTFDRGLNAADQVARREGLAAATVFRVFDEGAETSAEVMRRLDRAAFKASQTGQVAVIGTLSDQTVQAILQWVLEGKGSTVALAPVSALLSR